LGKKELHAPQKHIMPQLFYNVTNFTKQNVLGKSFSSILRPPPMVWIRLSSPRLQF